MKVVMYMIVSVDGYIATNDNDTPWPDELWNAGYEITKKYDGIIVGRNTYNLMKSNKDEFGNLGDPVTVTLSHSCDVEPVSLKHYCAESPKEALDRLNEKGLEKVLLCGGQQTNSAFLTEQFVDEIIIDVAPIMLGDGLRLTDNMPFQTELQLMKTEKIGSQSVRMHYRIKR